MYGKILATAVVGCTVMAAWPSSTRAGASVTRLDGKGDADVTTLELRADVAADTVPVHGGHGGWHGGGHGGWHGGWHAGWNGGWHGGWHAGWHGGWHHGSHGWGWGGWCRPYRWWGYGGPYYAGYGAWPWVDFGLSFVRPYVWDYGSAYYAPSYCVPGSVYYYSSSEPLYSSEPIYSTPVETYSSRPIVRGILGALRSGRSGASIRTIPDREILSPPATAPDGNETFDYDGGPSTPVPMPRKLEPRRDGGPPAKTLPDGRVVLRSGRTPRFRYPAYGERVLRGAGEQAENRMEVVKRDRR